jgi:hypothetical protein
MRALLVLLAASGAGGLVWIGVDNMRTTAPASQPTFAPPSAPLSQPPVQVPGPVTQQVPFTPQPVDPATHILTADVNLTCRVVVNGSIVGTFPFSKIPTTTVIAGQRYWTTPAWIEYWEGTVSLGGSGNRVVRLARGCFAPPGYRANIFNVSPMGGVGPSNYYCSNTSLSPIAATADVSLEWSKFAGGARVEFVFGQ